MATQQNPKRRSFNWEEITLLLFFISLPFLYNDNGVDPSLIPRQIGVAVLICILGCWLFWQQQKEVITITLIPIALTLMVLVYAVSCLQAINTIESLYIVLKIGLFACVGWVMYVLTKRNILTLRLLSLMVSFAGMITTMLAIGNMMMLENRGVRIFDADNMYKVNATFGHKNLLSSFLFLCLPMLVVQFAITTKYLWKIILGIAGIAAIGVLLLLQTRAVILALIICGIAVLVLLVSGFSNHLTRLQKRISVVLILSGFICSVCFFYAYREKLTLLTRTESFKERKNLWDNTWQMISEHPITGVGAANWQIHMPKYGMQKFYEVNYTISEGLTNFQRPHNDFLWVWAETGIVGFLLYVFIFTATLVYTYKLLKQEEKLFLKIGYAMLFLQVLGFIVISAVDFPLERIEHPTLMLMTIGFIAANHDAIQKWKGLRLKRWVWLVVAGIALLSLNVCTQRWRSELQLRKMYKAHAAGNWQKLTVEGTKAQTSYFNMDYYSIPIQWYVGVGYFMQDNLVAAKQSFEVAYQLHPFQVHVLNNYGTCYEKEGNHGKAIELLEESHRLSPTFSDGIINLSGAYFNAGRYDDAYRTITQFKYDEQNDRFKTFALAIIKVKLEKVIVAEKITPFATYLKRIVSNDQFILKAYQLAQGEGEMLLEWLRKQQY
ncbi:MAG: O-antigen ligase family protein [Bacteroidota bacterium]